MLDMDGSASAASIAVVTENLKQRVLAYERSLIVEALAATGGNQRRAAARLELLPTTLHEKMKRLGLLSTVEPVEGQNQG